MGRGGMMGMMAGSSSAMMMEMMRGKGGDGWRQHGRHDEEQWVAEGSMMGMMAGGEDGAA